MKSNLSCILLGLFTWLSTSVLADTASQDTGASELPAAVEAKAGETPQPPPFDQLLRSLENFPHIVALAQSELSVRDHELGLGALQKTRGTWKFKESERLSGQLRRYTGQVIDGMDSAELLDQLETQLQSIPGSEALFSCDGRSCGKAVQWANRIFGQRVLYGAEDLQRYRAYKVSAESEHRVVLYSSLRTADRQYFHLEVLDVTSSEGEAEELLSTQKQAVTQ